MSEEGWNLKKPFPRSARDLSNKCTCDLLGENMPLQFQFWVSFTRLTGTLGAVQRWETMLILLFSVNLSSQVFACYFHPNISDPRNTTLSCHSSSVSTIQAHPTMTISSWKKRKVSEPVQNTDTCNLRSSLLLAVGESRTKQTRTFLHSSSQVGQYSSTDAELDTSLRNKHLDRARREDKRERKKRSLSLLPSVDRPPTTTPADTSTTTVNESAPWPYLRWRHHRARPHST